MKQPSAGTILGHNVRRLRQQQGCSVALLADDLGWPEDRVLALESGTLDLDLDSIDRLSAALKSSPHELFSTAYEDNQHIAARRYG